MAGGESRGTFTQNSTRENVKTHICGMALEEEEEKRMVTASVQRLTISWPTAWVSSRGAVVLSGPVSRIEAKTLSQPYDSAAIAPDDGGSHIGGG